MHNTVKYNKDVNIKKLANTNSTGTPSLFVSRL